MTADAQPKKPSAPKPNVTPLSVVRPKSKGKMRPQKKRRIGILISAFLCVLLPAFAASYYYAFVASDQYAVEVRFAVRGSSTSSGGGEFLGILTGASAPGSTLTDSYIVMDYIQSQEMVRQLQDRIGLRKVYSTDSIDYLARADADAPIEEFVEYWNRRVTVSFDTSSQIIVAEVRAFSAEDAKMVAEQIIAMSEDLINDLSDRARQDTLRSAQEELQFKEDTLREARIALTRFRDTSQEIDPVKTAEGRLSAVAELEAQLGQQEARRAALLQFMNDKAPKIQFLDSQIAALGAQLEQRKRDAGVSDTLTAGTRVDKDGRRISSLLSSYDELQVDLEFAQQAYVSAFASLEQARVDASRQQRYLAPFVQPRLPEDAIYPYRILNTLMIIAVAGILWSLGVLIYYGVRDHIQ